MPWTVTCPGQASTPHPRAGLGWARDVGADPGLWAASPSRCPIWGGGLSGDLRRVSGRS